MTFPLDYPRFWAFTWAAAAATGIAYGIATRNPRKAAGLALMTVPLWIPFWGFINSIPALLDGGSVLAARSTYRLSTSYIRGILIDVGYIGTGFLLWAAPRTVPALAAKARLAGFQVWRSESRDAFAGALMFPAFLVGSYAVNWLIYSQAPVLVNGDETSVWDNMTPYHAIMISATAAFTEELVYRVLLLGILTWTATAAGLQRRPALAIAVVVQALFFGAAHAGYGTWAHVIVPTLFGLFVGVMVYFYGVWSAIVVHFLIDIYALGIYAIPAYPAWGTFLTVLLSLNTAVSVLWATHWLLRRRRTAPVRT